jgi:hypothetical protein
MIIQKIAKKKGARGGRAEAAHQWPSKHGRDGAGVYEKTTPESTHLKKLITDILQTKRGSSSAHGEPLKCRDAAGKEHYLQTQRQSAADRLISGCKLVVCFSSPSFNSL